MSELSSGRSSSALAITERKPHIQRPGGCVGIFFQLFDWNRRFAKKRFFPKKLLPPVRAKVSKKFNVNEKLPVTKHLLIADENSGGFPSKMKKKKNEGLEPKKNEMQAPGLVARLMGLDAMPVAVGEEDKSDRNGFRGDLKGKGGNFDGGSKSVELSPEKANVRPQKLQRTGVSERRPVTRFGAEALQIKNVLSRSRKHQYHHPKLVSPVKSPKMGRNNTSRLIDAAVRILEPGIQATSRARCSLSYPSSSVMQQSTEDVMGEVRGRVNSQSQFSSNSGEVQAPNVQGGCRSCGNIFGRVDVLSRAEEQSKDFDAPDYYSRERFFHGLDESRARPAVYLENENDVVLLKTRYQPERSPSQPEDSKPVQNEMIWNGMHFSQRHDQIPVSRIFTSQKNASQSAGFKSRGQRPGQMLGDKVPPKAKLANTPHGRRVSSSVNRVTEAKDFISLNRNVSQSRLKAPIRPDGFEADRRFQTGKNDSPAPQKNPIRKRRTLTANRQAGNVASASSSLENRRSDKRLVLNGNEPRIRSPTVNQSCPKRRPVNQRGSRDTIRTDVVSFTFNSPVKSSPGKKSHNEVGGRKRDPVSSVNEENVQQESITKELGTEQPSQNYLQMNGDALGALLEQKLKELTHQVENEAASDFMPSARTTASILQELISALTTERPISSEERGHASDRQDSEWNDIFDRISEANSRSKRSSDGRSHGMDHFSPGCVLDASFSNESCVSSSIEDNSVKLAPPDADLSDSASSTNQTQRSDITVVTDLVTHTSAVLEDVNCVHAKLSVTKRDYMQDIILNAELLFGNAGRDSSSRFVDFLLGPFLDELETLVVAAWKNSIILGIEVKKEENPLRRFLLDCLIECLDVKYSRYINSGFRTWSKLPKSINAEVLIKEFDEIVRKWISFAGKTPDEIIEREMSTSLGKWTDFDMEVFENGVEINQDIVQILVDEIVADLCASELSFC